MRKRTDEKGFLSAWLRSGLAAMAVILALAGGGVALFFTPREEEPQIDVPLIDIFVRAPGLSAAEVERRVVWPMEQTLFGTRGVEYVYSTSFQDGAIITARFYVGETPVESEVHVRNRLERNRHRYSPEMADYQIRPVYVDDVPFMTVTLHSASADDARLLSLAEEYLFDLTQIEGVGLISVVGGRNEAAGIELDPQRMAAHGVGFDELQRRLSGANTRISAGRLSGGDATTPVDIGRPLAGVEELRKLVVATTKGKPVLLEDVAEVREKAVDPQHHVSFASGPADGSAGSANSQDVAMRGAVTLALAKRPDANAVAVSSQVREKLEKLESVLASHEVELAVTRDYGRSADGAVDWLVFSLLGSSLVVMAILAASLGLREALIVAVSVPTTFAIALLINYLAGFSLNRVTLFALIVALGLIVDDSIVSIDNIHRYLHTRAGRGRSRLGNIAAAVGEVVPPMVLTSLVVVVAFLPLAFVTGLMGPYMAPMALTVPVAMLTSTVVATLIVPWLAQLILRERDGSEATGDTAESEDPGSADDDEVEQSRLYRGYARIVSPLLDRRGVAFLFLGLLLLLFAGSVAIPFLRLIPLKLLPHDDAEKIQWVVDQDEDASLESTAALTRELAAVALRQNEVKNVTTYAGAASPVDFNGLVRGYYLRQGPHVGDVRLNLVDDDRRSRSSHELALHLREAVRPVAEKYDASVKTIERPPGPPVLAPVVAEIRGAEDMPYRQLCEAAARIKELFEQEPGLVDVDTSLEADVRRLLFEVDRQKALLAGVTPEALGRLAATALRGADLSYLREEREIRPRPIRLRLPSKFRDAPERLEDLPVTRIEGRILTLGELGEFREESIDQAFERKNLGRVIYVTAGVAGRTPTDAVFSLEPAVEQLKASGELPAGVQVAFDGEGEWFLTRRVFRDLGIALGVALLAIYAMLVYQTKSYVIPVILLTSVPLTFIGIMPGFWLLNLAFTDHAAGHAIGIPFTATGMIGIVALAGIAVRNAILLVDFTQARQKEGFGVRDALLQAGALRVRPILLTAGTAMLAVIPIAFDPVFAGLAWSLIFGLLISTLITLVLVPTLYFLVYGQGEGDS